MNAVSNSITLFRIAGMFLACWVVPPLLCHYLGPAVGALGALGAGGFWYSQYRFPPREQRKGPYFWFVASGYGCIGITLVVCLGRLVGVSLF